MDSFLFAAAKSIEGMLPKVSSRAKNNHKFWVYLFGCGRARKGQLSLSQVWLGGPGRR